MAVRAVRGVSPCPRGLRIVEAGDFLRWHAVFRHSDTEGHDLAIRASQTVRGRNAIHLHQIWWKRCATIKDGSFHWPALRRILTERHTAEKADTRCGRCQARLGALLEGFEDDARSFSIGKLTGLCIDLHKRDAGRHAEGNGGLVADRSLHDVGENRRCGTTT